MDEEISFSWHSLVQMNKNNEMSKCLERETHSILHFHRSNGKSFLGSKLMVASDEPHE